MSTTSRSQVQLPRQWVAEAQRAALRLEKRVTMPARGTILLPASWVTAYILLC